MQVSAVSQSYSDVSSPRLTQRDIVAAAHGSALISALVFTVIIALVLAGMGTLTVSHYNLANVQAASSDALDVAEAGINWELHKLTNSGIASADNGGTIYNASDKIAAGLPGTFTVACATLDGSALTATTTMFTITSTAFMPTANGRAGRTVRINAQPYNTFYTLYSLASTSYLQTGIVINGISGTNGTQSMSSGMSVLPVIKGIVFNGNNANWANNQSHSGYSVVHNPTALSMPGTTSLVAAKFPGGQSYLAAHNDNSLATIQDPNNRNAQTITTNQYSLSTQGNQIVTLRGKPGGANYYLTNINMQGHSNLVFDNTAGPINIYYLNSNGTGSFMRGGHALRSLQDSPGNAVKMFMSATGGINLDAADPISGVSNSTEVDMGIYDYDSIVYNNTTYGYGFVNVGAGINFRGQIVANSISVYANANVVGQKGYFDTPNEYYGFSGAWTELDGAGNVGGANQ